jgi:hypothetical protein
MLGLALQGGYVAYSQDSSSKNELLGKIPKFFQEDRKYNNISNEIIEAIVRVETQNEGRWIPYRFHLVGLLIGRSPVITVYIYSIDLVHKQMFILKGLLPSESLQPGVPFWMDQIKSFDVNPISMDQVNNLFENIKYYKINSHIPMNGLGGVRAAFPDSPVMYLAIHEPDRMLNLHLTYNIEEDKNLLEYLIFTSQKLAQKAKK